MALESTTSKAIYEWDNVTVEFSYPKIRDGEDLYVSLWLDSGIKVQDISQTDYILSDLDDDGILTITNPTVLATVADKILLNRIEDLTQTLVLGKRDFPADDVEKEFDKSAMIDQQLQEQLNRTVQSHVLDERDEPIILPTFEEGKSIVWKDEDTFENSTYSVDDMPQDTDDLPEGEDNLYDKEVVLNEGENITISGTYPEFTIESIDTNTTDHQELTHLDWNNSGHAGYSNKLAGFDASGNAINVDLAVLNSHASLGDLEWSNAGHTIDTDVDFDNNGISDLSHIDFELDPTLTHQEGRLHWSDEAKTLELGMAGENVHLQLGQETLLRAKNTSGSTILNGTPVYINGADGSNPTIGVGRADNHILANATIAVATEDIANNSFGYSTAYGIVRDIDTTAVVTEGMPLFLGSTGGLVNALPDQPDSQVFIGVVLRKHATEGSMFVKIITQPNLDELSNVLIDTIQDNNLLQWDSTDGVWKNRSINDCGIVTQEEWGQNGFATKTTSTIDFTDLTRTFSIQPTGADFDYWHDGKKYTSTGDDVVISDVEGIHAIYYDGDTLIDLANPTGANMDSIIRTETLVCILYWNVSASSAIYVGEERHGNSMSPVTHSYLHFSIGLVYLNGLGLNNMSVDGSGDTASAQFGVDSGMVTDEDLALYSPTVGSTVGLPIYYMLGSTPTWNKYVEPGFSVRTLDGTDATLLAYNEFTGGAWQLTEESRGDYILYHIFATTDINSPIISIMGQNGYASKRAARAGALLEVHALVLDELLFPEVRPLATVIYQTKASYANSVNARVTSTEEGDDYIDWRSETISRTEISTSNHGALSGLENDDHPQYLPVDGSRSVTADIDITYDGDFVDTQTIGTRVITFTNDGTDYTSWTDTINTWTPTYTDGKLTSIEVT